MTVTLSRSPAHAAFVRGRDRVLTGFDDGRGPRLPLGRNPGTACWYRRTMVRITTASRRGTRETHDVGGTLETVRAAIDHSTDGFVRFGEKSWQVVVRVDEIVSLETVASPRGRSPSKAELISVSRRERDRQQSEAESERIHAHACSGGTRVVIRSKIDGNRTSHDFALPFRAVLDALLSGVGGVVRIDDGLAPPPTIRVDWVESVLVLPDEPIHQAGQVEVETRKLIEPD